MSAHVQILKSKSKKNPFRVKYIGKNGETLATSETLATRLNAKKNILAMMSLFPTGSVVVYDYTRKNGPLNFHLGSDGHEETIS